MESVPETRLIAVRNRAQAREWALALLSQGIESRLVEDDSTSAFALEVSAARCGDALRILKLYHVENRGWGLRRELPVVHLAFNWGCLGWAFVLGLIHFLATLPGSQLTEAGVLTAAAVHGEWWRLFTAISLHADLGHLVSNLMTGTLLLGLCMARFGGGLGVLGPWLAGVLANVAAVLIRDSDYRSLGASGMVLAALGVLTAAGAGDALRHRPGWKPLLATLAAGVMLFVFTGSNPDSDVLVHLGGFVAGLAVGGLLEGASVAGLQRAWQQGAALTLVGFSFVASWWWALQS